jgi:hypothetical protein
MSDPGSVTVRTFQSTMEAEIAKGALEAAGIQAFVQADDAGGMRPHLQQHGVALMVAAEDAARAERVLSGSARRRTK